MNHNNHTTKEETIYTCPMHPEVRKTEPGHCPGCGMDLIPLDKARGKPEKMPARQPVRQSLDVGGIDKRSFRWDLEQ